ncbi:hypothetical protein LTSEURB_6700, partial [Salmonella enterica subsp. enterica serovar Urbana str. R8-2977]
MHKKILRISYVWKYFQVQGHFSFNIFNWVIKLIQPSAFPHS